MSDPSNNIPVFPKAEEPEDRPAVYAVHKHGGKVQFSRRDFLTAAGAVAAAGVVLGCGAQSKIFSTGKSTSTHTPAPSSTQLPTFTPRPTETPELGTPMSLSDCQTILTDKNPISRMVLSKDGKVLVSDSYDEITSQSHIKLWYLPDQALIAMMEGITAVAISPDSQTLAASNESYGIQLHSLPDGLEIKTNYELSSTTYSMAFSPDGKLLATAGDSDLIQLWSIPEGALVKEIQGQSYGVYHLCFSPDGNLLATAGADNNVNLFSVSDGALVQTLTGHSGVTYNLEFSPDGQRLVSVGVDGAVKLWALPAGELLSDISPSYMFALSPDGNYLAAAANSGFNIKLVAAKDGEQLMDWEPQPLAVTSLAISPDSRLLATGGEDTNIKIWTMPDGQLVRELSGHTDKISALIFSPDGRMLYSGSADHTIKIWNVEGGFFGCLMDLADTPADVEGITYTTTNAAGQTITYTLPCGSPIPAGAICSCNCVAGAGTPICSCVGDVCSCVGDVCSCVGNTGDVLTYWYPN